MKLRIRNAMVFMLHEWENPYGGICGQVFKEVQPSDLEKELFETTLEDAFKTWEKFSGNECYPIPSFDERDACQLWWTTPLDEMWSGDQGVLRRELLQHCINYFEDQLLLEGLKSIRDNGPDHEGIGMCSNLAWKYHLPIDQKLKPVFPLWPQYSGCEEYPVPGVDDQTPQQCYIYNQNLGTIWEGAYGELRYELLDFCINHFEGKLNREAA